MRRCESGADRLVRSARAWKAEQQVDRGALLLDLLVRAMCELDGVVASSQTLQDMAASLKTVAGAFKLTEGPDQLDAPATA